MKSKNSIKFNYLLLLICAAFAVFFSSHNNQWPFIAMADNSKKPAIQKDEDWEIFSIFGPEIFPSYIVTVSMLNTTYELDKKAQPDIIGAPFGAIGFHIKAPIDNSKIKIELSGSKFIRKSDFEGVLPKGGTVYEIYPYVKYDYEALLSVHQPVPEDLTATVTLNDKSLGEKTITFRVRTISDCILALLNEGSSDEDLSWTFVAYVNENHPFIDAILKEALEGDVKSFGGYLGNKDAVLSEIEAIWNAVQKRGMKYSSISTPVAESDYVASQHVRMLGESIKYGQANCIDGTVLFASLFRKIGLNTYLMLTSDHAFLGVDLTEDGKNRIYIETTLVDDGPLDDAISVGNKNISEYGAKKDLTTIDVNKWRENGITPLKDTTAEGK